MISVSEKSRATGSKTIIYTIGYEGISFETFLRKLSKVGIKQILDVRCNPISRKPGFSKNQLKERLSAAKIDYFHFPELGIPSCMRRELNSKSDYARLFDEYEAEILPHAREQMEKVVELMKTMPSALLCFEDDRECCHRTRLAIVIANETGFQKNYL